MQWADAIVVGRAARRLPPPIDAEVAITEIDKVVDWPAIKEIMPAGLLSERAWMNALQNIMNGRATEAFLRNPVWNSS